MSKLTVEDFYEKLLKVNEEQQSLTILYGLCQIKYMFDVDKVLEVEIPEGAKLIGLSSMGRFTSIDYDKEIRYSYFPHSKTWSEALDFANVTEFDKIEDFKCIYEAFDLNNYELSDLIILI